MRSLTVKVNNINIHYLEAGSDKNPTVILIHGFHNTAASAQILIKPVAKYFHVITPDLPGFGKSEQIKPKFSLKSCGSVLHNFAKELRIDKYYLAGFSMGAGIALETILITEKYCQGLILIYPLAFGKYIKINKKKRLAINTLVMLTKFPITKHLTRKMFYSDRLMFQLFKRLSDSKNTTESEIHQRIKNARTCRFTTYMQGVSEILKYTPSKHKRFLHLKSFLILNNNDELIDPQLTQQVYQSYFPNIKLKYLNFDKHIPSQSDIEETFKTEFPKIISEIHNEFGIEIRLNSLQKFWQKLTSLFKQLFIS